LQEGGDGAFCRGLKRLKASIKAHFVFVDLINGAFIMVMAWY